jgi:acyl-CoA thioester hydrolase
MKEPSPVHEKRIEIRWSDMDVYGYVNNAIYLTYLEEARDEWLGGSLGDRDQVWNWVLARVEIDYRRELALADDMAVATCRLDRIGNSTVTTHEEVRTVDGELAAEAKAVLVARDRESGRSRPLTAAERAAFEAVATDGGRSSWASWPRAGREPGRRRALTRGSLPLLAEPAVLCHAALVEVQSRAGKQRLPIL